MGGVLAWGLEKCAGNPQLPQLRRRAGKKGRAVSAPAAIGGDALIRHPQAGRCRARLPEHIDRDAARAVPVTADP